MIYRTKDGGPLVAAEGQIVALDFRMGVSDLWSITSARHSINGGGFTTSIKTEKPKMWDWLDKRINQNNPQSKKLGPVQYSMPAARIFLERKWG